MKRLLKSKQGMNVFPLLIMGIIALVVLVIILMFFTRSSGEGFSIIDGQIDELGDCDDDGVVNKFDEDHGCSGDVSGGSGGGS